MFRILYLPGGYYIRLSNGLARDQFCWPPGDIWEQGYYGLFSKKKAYAFAREFFSSSRSFCPINHFVPRRSFTFSEDETLNSVSESRGWTKINITETLIFNKVPKDYFEIVQVPVSYHPTIPDGFIRSGSHDLSNVVYD